MSIDLQLKSSCSGCGTATDLYGSNCKHMTMCLSCGKTMAENRGTCYECGTTITGLIREYVVRSSSSCDKNYSINRFVAGMPIFSKKESAENRWTMHKEGLQGRQVTDSLREKYKNRPWLLEDETGQSQFLGQLEGSQSATYYLLMMQGKEFVAIPAGSWYNFNKVAHYKQLTLEEAEEKMKNRRKTADGYQRWMMKTANNGPAAFGETELDDKESGGGGGGGGKTRKKNGDADEAHVSDRGEEDDEEEAMRKDRLGLNKKGAGDNDDEEEGLRGGDLDLDLDDDIEKGDDWEHDETFTDDDEALGNDPEEREDVDPEVPAPPEIKQDEEDEDETNEEEGGLSKSGKELQKLLGRTAGLNESDADDEDDDDDLEDDVNLPPVLASKPKEEPVDNSPAKPVPSGPSRATPPSSKSAKAKRKLNGDDPKPTNVAPKKVKTENDSKSAAKDEAVATKSGVAVKGTPSSSSKQGSASSAGPVTEDEIRATLLQKSPVTTQDLVANFKARLRTGEDKKAFAEILKRMSKIQKTNGSSYVVLREM